MRRITILLRALSLGCATAPHRVAVGPSTGAHVASVVVVFDPSVSAEKVAVFEENGGDTSIQSRLTSALTRAGRLDAGSPNTLELRVNRFPSAFNRRSYMAWFNGGERPHPGHRGHPHSGRRPRFVRHRGVLHHGGRLRASQLRGSA